MWRSKWCRHLAMHLVSLESLGFRSLNINTTDYCYRQYIYIYIYIPLYPIVDIHMQFVCLKRVPIDSIGVAANNQIRVPQIHVSC